MSETTENTFTGYLGHDFQTKLMWQILVEPEFAEEIIPNLAVEYFDDPNVKRLFLIIYEFYKEYQKVPNLQNKSIIQAIHQFKKPGNLIEEECLFSILKNIELWNERVLNKSLMHDGDAVQKSTNFFIKQQEYRKVAEQILDKTKNGEIKNKYTINSIEEKLIKISQIGVKEDEGTEVFDNISRALRKEFRQTIPTGIQFIDAVTGGGLGKGEIGVILTPSGVGKTTALTKIANSAYEQGKNVAQIIFEDTVDQIQRKHYAIWSKTPLSQIDDNIDSVSDIIVRKAEELKGNGGHLMIKRFSQEDTTIKDIKNWMIRHQKKYGYKFDILIIDYLDCVESHKKTQDRNEGELVVIKAFEALSSDFEIPAWTALQTNRTGFNAEYIEANQTGGNIKRIQKAHFFMSVAKTKEQKEAQLANVQILKARFAQDGQQFKDCIFNNDTVEIRLENDQYKYSQFNKTVKHHDDKDIDVLESMRLKYEEIKAPNIELHAAISQHSEDNILSVINNENINNNDFKTISNNFENEISVKKENIELDNCEIINSDVIISTEPNENKLEELPIISEKTIISSEDGVLIQEIVSLVFNENDLIDPDELENKNNNIYDQLNKLRESQSVIKKE